jgi:hypothetical protein
VENTFCSQNVCYITSLTKLDFRRKLVVFFFFCVHAGTIIIIIVTNESEGWFFSIRPPIPGMVIPVCCTDVCGCGRLTRLCQVVIEEMVKVLILRLHPPLVIRQTGITIPENGGL